jgi:type II secretory pathway pseudopilin PulG
MFLNPMIKISNKKKGYTLIEALVYVAIFILVSAIIVGLLLSVLETGRQISPVNSLSRDSSSVLEVISREIRRAKSVDIGNSIFNVSTGSLQLNTLDITGNPRTVRFYLDGNTVKINENGEYVGPLNSSDVMVTSLIFNLATSTKQDLVKIEIDLMAGEDKYQKSEKFYSSVKLRVDN